MCAPLPHGLGNLHGRDHTILEGFCQLSIARITGEERRRRQRRRSTTARSTASQRPCTRAPFVQEYAGVALRRSQFERSPDAFDGLGRGLERAVGQGFERKCRAGRPVPATAPAREGPLRVRRGRVQTRLLTWTPHREDTGVPRHPDRKYDLLVQAWDGSGSPVALNPSHEAGTARCASGAARCASGTARRRSPDRWGAVPV